MKDAEHREWSWGASVSELDGRYLFLYVSRDTARVRIFLLVSRIMSFTSGRFRKIYSGWQTCKKTKSAKTSSGRS